MSNSSQIDTQVEWVSSLEVMEKGRLMERLASNSQVPIRLLNVPRSSRIGSDSYQIFPILRIPIEEFDPFH